MADNLGLPSERRTAPASSDEAAKVRAEHGHRKLPALTRDERQASIDEIIAVRIAAELDNESFASAGAVSPLANVAYRLAKATHAPDMIIATMSCGHLDIAPSPMILSLIESLDGETAVAHAGGDDTYSTYYQAGAVTHEIVAAAQVDRRGRVNTIALRKRDGGLDPAARAGRHGRRRQHAPRLSALRSPAIRRSRWSTRSRSPVRPAGC